MNSSNFRHLLKHKLGQGLLIFEAEWNHLFPRIFRISDLLNCLVSTTRWPQNQWATKCLFPPLYRMHKKSPKSSIFKESLRGRLRDFLDLCSVLYYFWCCNHHFIILNAFQFSFDSFDFFVRKNCSFAHNHFPNSFEKCKSPDFLFQ